MFKNLRTSKQISLKFTLFSAAILVVVAFIVNLFFFYSWYIEAKQPSFSQVRVLWGFFPQPSKDYPWFLDREWGNTWENNPPLERRNMQRKIDGTKFSPKEKFPLHELRLDSDSEDAKQFLEKNNFLSIVEIDWYYLYIQKVWNEVLVRNVTSQVNLQTSLIWITICVFVFWTLLSYIVSLWFVKTSLKKLNTLNEALEHLDIDHLDKKIDIVWAEDDEINKVIKVFNKAIEKIHLQTIWLKDFVRNASHELRTPLMWISTLIDVARKSKDYEGALIEVKSEIKRMDALLETLLLITRLEETVWLEKEVMDLVPSIKNTIKQLEDEYKEKDIHVSEELPNSLMLSVHNQWWHSIMTNLLRNAFKYVDDQGKINIILNEKSLEICNTWKIIEKNDIDHIRERFWQGDNSHSDSKSFWLWLYLSKLFAEKQEFDLTCESEEWKGTTFILKFN